MKLIEKNIKGFDKSYYLILLVTFILISCNGNESTKTQAQQSNSTIEMAQELKDIASNKTDINVWHLNRLRAMAIDEQINSQSDLGQKISLLFKSAIEWLNAGEFDNSLNRLNSIFNLIEEKNLNLPSDAYYSIKEVLAIVYFRKAEIDNCIQNHNEYSCIIPIDKKGQHIIREDAESAKKIFRDLLATPQATLQTKWLYNLTHMALGGYPEEVEPEYLIDPSLFNSEVDFPRFKDIGMSLGVAVNDIAGSVVMEDFDNDGFLDLMVSSYGLDDQLRYFRNDTKGGFKDRTTESGLNGLWSGLNMVQADYNNDGWVDILVLRGAWLGKNGNHPNSLIKNNGDGTFSDVTKEAGLYCHFPTQTATWADFNNDGWIDLFIGNEHSANNNSPSQLFRNNGNGTFTDIARESGAAVNGFIKGCISGDYNNDNYPDLYLSLINGNNILLKNGGPNNNFSFTNESNKSKTSEPQFSFPCWFFDYNQDGWEDLFVSGFDFSQFQTAAGEVAKEYLNLETKAEKPRLYRNNGDETFTEVSSELNIDKPLYTMGCNYGDLNNDGFPDFYAATGTPDFRALIPNRMFLNDNGEIYYDVTTAGGFGHLQKGHGVAFGDLDNDGDQDIYNVLGGSYDGDNFMNALFLNPGNQNNWLKLKLVGTTCNKSAIGAKVKIFVSNKNGDKRTFYSRVNSGGSFGANPLLIEQGLGAFQFINSLEIYWPNENEPQIIKDVKVNSYVRITQGIKEPQLIELNKIDFDMTQHHHHH